VNAELERRLAARHAAQRTERKRNEDRIVQRYGPLTKSNGRAKAA
jgi:hypothetical protein